MSIGAILSLLITVAEAGGKIYAIWKDAGDVIENAEVNAGVVDPVAYAALVKKCEEAMLALRARAEEAAQP